MSRILLTGIIIACVAVASGCNSGSLCADNVSRPAESGPATILVENTTYTFKMAEPKPAGCWLAELVCSALNRITGVRDR